MVLVSAIQNERNEYICYKLLVQVPNIVDKIKEKLSLMAKGGFYHYEVL